MLRLGDDEAFFCPECARPLVPAPAWRGRRYFRSILVGASVLLLAGSGAAIEFLARHDTAAPVMRAAPLPRRVVAPPIRPPAQPLIPVAPPAAAADAPVSAPTWPVAPKHVRAPQTIKAKPPQPPAAPHAADASPATAEAQSPPQPSPPPAPAAPATQAAAPPKTTPDTPAAPGPRVIVLPPGSSVSFGPLQGVNLPALPSHMMFVNPEQARKPGSIQVDCKIGLDGVPADCHKIAEKGGADVSATILDWLASGAIRYTPATKDGRKVVERRVLTVNFGGSAASAN